MKEGILLVNLGTPTAPTGEAVRLFLKEFLSDPYVIDYPRWFWLTVLNQIILRVRPDKSAKLYQNIWMDEGSPLMIYSERLAVKLQTVMPEAKVVLAMRYGEPSIQAGLQVLRDAGVERVTTLPLYPQYSITTVATILDEVTAVLQKMNWSPTLHQVRDYYENPIYTAAIADSVRTHWAKNGRSEKLIISMHGNPARYTKKGDPYVEQCKQTAQNIAAALELTADEWMLTFQSRFGPEAWLQPYTDKTMEALGEAGVKRVDVICPGFSTDCLETIDEINRENRHFFMEAGGEEFYYIPSLNDSDAHVGVLTAVCQSAT
jgi:ferrochelatase